MDVILMFMQNGENYEKILERISRSSGVEKEELDRRVEAKRAKLSGLISKDGAAQIIAAELGINFDNERMKINELLPGMKRANVVGKVINLFPVRTFERQGRKNKVANFILADETSNVKVVLWDTNHIELIEKNQIEKNTVVEIFNGSVRDGELHLGSFSEFRLSNEQINDVKTEISFAEKKIFDFVQGANLKVRAFIVQAFPPRQFESKVNPGEKGFLMNIVLDDGSETIRAVMFGDTIKELGLSDLEDINIVEKEKKDLLGKEMFFTGSVRLNSYFNNLEFSINKIDEVNVSELIKVLEK